MAIRDVLKDLVVRHEVFVNVHDEVLTHLDGGYGPGISLVIGPAGVGKSHLMKALDAHLVHAAQHSGGKYAPPLVLEIFGPETGDLSFKDLYTELLLQLQEPGLRQKRDPAVELEYRRKGMHAVPYRALSIAELRRLLLQALRAQKPRVLLFDEGDHLKKTETARGARIVLNVLKSLANRSEMRVVIFGTHATQDLLFQGGQLTRRVAPIEFPRYPRTGPGLGQVAAILKEVAAATNATLAFDPASQAAFLYDHCLGCIGVLCDWFCRAANRSKGQKVVRWRDFEATALTAKALEVMLTEFVSYELSHKPHAFDYEKVMHDVVASVRKSGTEEV